MVSLQVTDLSQESDSDSGAERQWKQWVWLNFGPHCGKGWVPAEWVCALPLLLFTTVGAQPKICRLLAGKQSQSKHLCCKTQQIMWLPLPIHLWQWLFATCQLTHMMWVGREIPLDVEGSKINRSFILFDWKNIVNIDGKWELYKWLEEVSNGYFVANGKTSIWKAKINNIVSFEEQSFYFMYYVPHIAHLVSRMVKNLPSMQETRVQSLGQEDPLEKGMAAHSSILAWRVPWTEEPGRPQSTGSQKSGIQQSD